MAMTLDQGDSYPLYETVVLDKIATRIVHYLDPQLGAAILGDLELATWRDQACYRMAYELSTYVLGEKLVDKTVERVAKFEHKSFIPASWWQHFKRDVLAMHTITRWFVKWRPVKLTTVTTRKKAILTASFQQYATFPSADIRTPESIHRRLVVPYETTSASMRTRLD